jgi:hypothetical protein
MTRKVLFTGIDVEPWAGQFVPFFAPVEKPVGPFRTGCGGLWKTQNPPVFAGDFAREGRG